jgi:hypothetical protein
VKALPRKLGLFVAGTAAVCGMTVLAPATASAATPAAAAPAATAFQPQAPQRCRPAHWGRAWRWHETRWGGHWDHKVWNRWRHRAEWKHEWRENRYCAKRWDNRWDDRRGDGNRGPNGAAPGRNR